jgi:outer membrane protein OmpA-like peptidoglycan-associated protein
MRNVARCLVTSAVLLVARGASAQTTPIEYKPGFDPEQLQVSGDPGSVALQDGAHTLAMRDYAVGLMMHLDGPPLDICVSDPANPDTGCDPSASGDLLNTQFRSDLLAIVGLGRFDVRAMLPLVLHQSSDFGPAMGQSKLSSAGIGDLRLGGRVHILDKSGFDLAGDLSFTVPIGGGNNFIGDSGTLIDPRVLAEYRKSSLSLAASFGFRYRQKPATLANLYVGDELSWSLGGEYAIQPDKLSAGLGVFGHLGVQKNPDPMAMSTTISSEERPAEVMATGRYFVSPKIAIDLGLGTALSSGYGTPPFRVLAGVQWMNVTKRRPAPEPIPEPPVVDKDVDGDGILDKDDQCPKVAEDKDGFQDDDGCPDIDNDGDGILDTADKCPMDAEDKDGFEDDDGCPDLDNDADGIPDTTDKCPTDAEDIDGFQDDDGCPDPDNDADGIPDTTDQCPLEAEVMNGIKDDDGCPDKAGAIVTSRGIEISDRVFFDLDKAHLKHRSYKILDAVVTVMKENPDLLIRIEGHTDDQGDADFNIDLSQRRAEAVRDYLVKKGIDKKRLLPVGFGFSRPLIQGTEEKERAQNRRVEFVIITDMTDTGNPPTPSGK